MGRKEQTNTEEKQKIFFMIHVMHNEAIKKTAFMVLLRMDISVATRGSDLLPPADVESTRSHTDKETVKA